MGFHNVDVDMSSETAWVEAGATLGYEREDEVAACDMKEPAQSSSSSQDSNLKQIPPH